MITVRNMEVMHVDPDPDAEFMVEVGIATDEQDFQILRLPFAVVKQFGSLLFVGMITQIEAMSDMPTEAKEEYLTHLRRFGAACGVPGFEQYGTADSDEEHDG